MSHRYIRVGATVLVLGLALTGLMWSTLREGTEYFLHVDEVMAEPQAWEGKQLQLHGYVVPGSRTRTINTLEWKFKVQNNPARSGQPGHVVDVYYKGVVPDTFNDEAEVVLKGRLTPQAGSGTGGDGEQGSIYFHTAPNGVIAKCPSKYEAASKAAGSPAGL